MTYERITSQRNPLIETLKSLKDKRGRDKTGLMMVEGEKMLGEALKCGLNPKYLLCGETKIESLSALFKETGATIYEVTDNVLKSVCDTVTPPGCACAFSLPKPLGNDISLWPDMLVALDGVQDPGNVGTIWRTADAAGFHALIAGADCADLSSPKVQRAGMGSGFRLPCRSESDLAARLKDLKNAGYEIIVSSLNGEPFYSMGPTRKKLVLVVGSEAHGVRNEVADLATKRLKLPMRGGAESLNAAVAAGIMMYELAKGLDSTQ